MDFPLFNICSIDRFLTPSKAEPSELFELYEHNAMKSHVLGRRLGSMELTLLLLVYPDECSPELEPCEYCICNCEKTSNQGSEWCGAKCAPDCFPVCPECIG
ncbi:hypothetical protein C1646_751930 [Rhizophagus diaphanus]|nr:hypothetical protein C1646_751930 [Rhizophagus diaphanus] [Rhizophagus sp. MUCL 43196]